MEMGMILPWVRGIWEVLKEMMCQKLLAYHLPSPSPSPSPHPDLSCCNIIINNNNHLLMAGVSIIVTGATSGIGLHTARELVLAGAHVVMACRNTKSANEIANQWREEAHNSNDIIPNIEVMELDLLSLASVRRFAAAWLQREKPLHVLINNAGILLMGEPQRLSKDGIEQHMQVNHVGPALLTLLLLPSLLRAPSSRIINVNSVAHHCAIVDPRSWNTKTEHQWFSSMKAYGASKLVNLMFLKGLANKLLDQNKSSIQCIAVHPGIVTTNLVRGLQKKSFWRFDPAEGARSVVFCATNKDIGDNLIKGFAYYSCNCKPGRVSSQAENMDSCLEVWQKTLEVLQAEPDSIFDGFGI